MMVPVVSGIAVLVALGFLWALLFRKPYVPALTATFDGEPADYRGEKTLIVAVYAPWASVWRTATETALAGLDMSRYDLRLVHADRERELVGKLGVQIVPTVLVLRDGKVVQTLPNLMSLETLDQT